MNASDKENDKAIHGCVEKSSDVIFAWGSFPNENKIAKDRVQDLLSKLKPYLDKCYYLSDATREDEYHPLAAKIRYDWTIVKYK